MNCIRVSYTSTQERKLNNIESHLIIEGDGPILNSIQARSNIELTQSLLNFMETMEKDENTLVGAYPSGEIDYSKRIKGG